VITPHEFDKAVEGQVGPVMAEAGLAQVFSAEFITRYDRDRVFVQVDLDAQRSLEVNVWTGQVDDTEPPLSLGDLLRATGCPAEKVAGVELMQAKEAVRCEDFSASEPTCSGLSGLPSSKGMRLLSKGRMRCALSGRVATRPSCGAGL
jgi:hypothetical protein